MSTHDNKGQLSRTPQLVPYLSLCLLGIKFRASCHAVSELHSQLLTF